MSTSAAGQEKLIEMGWHALVEKLGVVDATKFIMTIDKGTGDSVKYFNKLWEGKRSEEIYEKMIKTRKS